MEQTASQTTEKQLAEALERLKKLEETVQTLQQRVEQYETKQPPHSIEKQETPEKAEDQRKITQQAILELDLMNLPDSLRKTMLIIAKHGETTPEEISEETNRTRGLENIYLNQLERLGYVEKTKRGKRVYFRSLRII